MPTHAEQRRLNYTSEQLFDLVADVERYPEFLPWCASSKVRPGDDENSFRADLMIGYKMIRERFGSEVTLRRPDEIEVRYTHGPMKHLKNHWRFIREPDGSCLVDFYVDFEFKNALLQRLMGVFFNEIVRRMVGAFETRAQHLYGAGLNDPQAASDSDDSSPVSPLKNG